MSRSRIFAIILTVTLVAPLTGNAQEVPQTTGTAVLMPAFGEVSHINDEAYVTFMVEEQDKEKGAAASHANKKMREGMDLVRREDPQASLKTKGYYTYPVYPDEPVSPRQGRKPPQPVAWRVVQLLEVTTRNIDHLPKTVAAAQNLLAVNGLRFGLSPATSRKLEEQRIAAAYRNLAERIAAAAKAMGRSVADATLESVDFEASGGAPEPNVRMFSTMKAGASMEPVEEPNFEPGETTLNMRVVGKIRFK